MSIARGLVGWWRLDGNLTDASGNGNNLTATGSPDYIAGRYGQGVQLDGSTKWLGLDAPYTFSNPSTFSAWINFGRVSTSPEYFLGGSGSDLRGARYNSTNFLINDGSAGPYVTVSWEKVSGYVFFVMRRTSSTAYDIWINGVNIGGGNSATSTSISVDFIGRRGREVLAANIDIDNAMIYNRALSPSEIKTLYALGSPI